MSSLRLLPLVWCCQCIVWPETSTLSGETGRESDSASASTDIEESADTSDTSVPVYEPQVIPCAPEQTPFPHCGCLTFATSIGSYFGDVGYALAATPSGGVALAGEFGGVVTFGEGQPNETTLTAVDAGPYTDGFVALYSVTGELLWVRQHSNSYYSEAKVVAVDGSGRVAVGGEYLTELTVEGGGVQHVLPEDSDDGYIVSYDSEGTLQWAVYTNSDDNEELTGLAFGPSGELYVVGYSEAQTVDVFSTDGSRLRMEDMGTGGLNGETAAFLLRIEPTGALSWAQRLTGAGYQKLYSVAVLADGNLVVAGDDTTELVLDEGGPNELLLTPAASLFFATYTDQGIPLAAQMADGIGTTYTGGVVDADTDFVFAGQTGDNTLWAPGTPQELTTPSRGLSFARYTNEGTLQSVYSASGNISPAALATNTARTSFAVAGLQTAGPTTFGSGEPHEVTVDADPGNTNAWDPLLLVLDEEGLLDCFWHLDGAETFDQAYSVTYDNSDGIWVTGKFTSTLTLAAGRPDETVLQAVDSDLFLARFQLRPPVTAPDDTASQDTAGTESP